MSNSPAGALLLLVLLAAAATWSVVVLVADVRADGLGRRRPPHPPIGDFVEEAWGPARSDWQPARASRRSATPSSAAPAATYPATSGALAGQDGVGARPVVAHP